LPLWQQLTSERSATKNIFESVNVDYLPYDMHDGNSGSFPHLKQLTIPHWATIRADHKEPCFAGVEGGRANVILCGYGRIEKQSSGVQPYDFCCEPASNNRPSRLTNVREMDHYGESLSFEKGVVNASRRIILGRWVEMNSSRASSMEVRVSLAC
jgi:hypothetical protein